jgi:small nuclear ribonucleoprotein (snRNP)-like protein
MEVGDVLRTVFNEFAENIKEGREELIGQLKGTDGKVFIALKESDEVTTLKIRWLPRESSSSALEFVAGPMENKEWIYGKGIAMKETIRLYSNLFIDGPEAIVMAEVFKRVAELVALKAKKATFYVGSKETSP